ncbi:MAG: tyrosine-type recombinase/integrase [Lachnospiraceae bacterium]|nr:tyrosine-type recombinase/integrase [Lachnospiraceae bacterium]
MEQMIQEILMALGDDFTREQLTQLSNVLTIKLHGYRLVKECTDVVPVEAEWEGILKLYLASKRLENCSEGTIAGYGRCITVMLQSINKPLRDVTTNDLRYYLAMYQTQRHISLSYLETLRHYISAFFTWAQDEGYVAVNPVRRLNRIKVPKKIKQPYTAEEREILKCNATRERDLAIMEVLYSTACRIGEIVPLNRSDINFTENNILIYGQKGKSERMVYLTESASYHLRKYLESRTDDNPALFVSCRAPHNRLSKQAIQAMLRALGRKTGIHAHPHKFRRSLLTDAGARGVPLQELQKYAGHVKTDTTMIYVTVREESVRASFERLIA